MNLLEAFLNNSMLNENIQTEKCTWSACCVFTLAVPGSRNRVYQHSVTFLTSPAGDHPSRSPDRKACSWSFLGVGKTSGREGVTAWEGGSVLWIRNPTPSSLLILTFFTSG